MDVILTTLLACAGLLGIAIVERLSSERLGPEAPRDEPELVSVSVRRS